MADLLLLDALGSLKRACVPRRVDILAETDEWLTLQFRLPRTVLIQICNLLDPQLQRETRRSNPIPPHVQVLTTLGLLATGTFQRDIGDRSGVSHSSVSCVLPLVIKAKGVSLVLALVGTLPPQPTQRGKKSSH